ncbi:MULTISPECIES: glycosyltransferase family 39 protein [unclassified Thermococcus]|uniref:glycosyltransferase family 39 protein n=1 Tax=unclassified Thermococcus TaxID=2627626 RepID=UPI00143211F2
MDDNTTAKPNSQKRMKLPDPYKAIIVLIITGFVMTVAYKLFLCDTPPLIWDAATHFMDSVKYYLALTHFNLGIFPYINRYWPPLGSLFPIPAYAIFRTSPQTGIFAENILSIAILILALHKLSKYFGKIAIVVSTFVVLMSPIILDQATTFMIDLPLTAMVMMTWYLLLKSEGFSQRKYTTLSAVFFGLGLLAKWTFVFFVLVVFLYEVAISFGLKMKGTEIRIKLSVESLKELAIFATVVLMVAGWWYVPNLKVLLNSLLYNSRISGAIEGDPPVLTIQSALYYTYTMINFYLNPILFALFVGILVLLLCRARNISVYIKLVLIQILLTYMVFTLTRNKDPRFLMPVIPFIGLVMGSGVELATRLENGAKIASALMVCIVLGGALNVATFLRVIPQTEIYKNPDLIPISGGSLYLSGNYWSFNLDTTEEEWEINRILSTVEELGGDNGILYILSNNPLIAYPLKYRALINGSDLKVVKPDTSQLIPLVFSADYVLYTTSEYYSARWKVKYSTLARKLFITYNNITGVFIPIEKFEFPDGTIGILYRHERDTALPLNISTDATSVTCKGENVSFGDKVQLTAICIYRIEGIDLIEYRWKTLEEMDADYTIFVHLTDESGNTLFQMDHKPCSGLCPTSTWEPEDRIVETYYLEIPSPGCYQIRLGFWDPINRVRLSVEGDKNDGHSRAMVGQLCYNITTSLDLR